MCRQFGQNSFTMINFLKDLLPDEKRKFLSRKYHRLKNLGMDYYPGESVESLRDKINLYSRVFPSAGQKYSSELKFINSRSRKDFKFSYILPYDFVFDYDAEKVGVLFDDVAGLHYVMHGGKRLYYSKDFPDISRIRFTYNCIRIEQDLRSPHRYLTDDFNVKAGDVVIDLGAAEGNFALDVVDRAGMVYIFETDSKWIEALNHTFAPWKEKVKIINKFVSDADNDNCVTLEKLFGNSRIDFIKMDVEGAETKILSSSRKILAQNSSLKLAVCTYHADSDFEEVGNILNSCGYRCCPTDGHMLFIYSRLKPPYFRKVLLRASRKEV